MNFDDIKKLMEDMGNSKIDSLNIEFPDGIKISMKKEVKVIQNEKEPLIRNEINNNIKETTVDTKEDYKIIKAPMVGTFYSSNSPKEEPFVKVGDKVKKGQVLCIVEAMKLMNEIESEFDGEIVEVCAENEDMVEFGMPLFKIK